MPTTRQIAASTSFVAKALFTLSLFTLSLVALSLVALMPLAVGGQALAQSQTGTGGGPGSTVTAPNTSTVGRVKPPGSAAGADTPDDRRTRTPTEKQDDKIQKGICIGCGAK